MALKLDLMRKNITAEKGLNSEALPKLLAIADTALLIEFGNTIDSSTNKSVLGLMRAIDKAMLPSILEIVPSYRSLLVHYNPVAVSFEELEDSLKSIICSNFHEEESNYVWKVPVCYGGEHGIDLESVAEKHQISTAEVIQLHIDALYRVFMVGFAPGYCYLGGLNEKLHIPRLPSPRLKIPAGSIAIGGQQSIIGALEMPSGWHLLGQTPIKTFDPNRSSPFFIEAGDSVQFYPISSTEYHKLKAASDAGEIIAQKEIIT